MTAVVPSVGWCADVGAAPCAGREVWTSDWWSALLRSVFCGVGEWAICFGSRLVGGSVGAERGCKAVLVGDIAGMGCGGADLSPLSSGMAATTVDR